MVGTSGSAEERVAPFTASAASLPSRISGRAAPSARKAKSIRPATSSVIISAPPLNGTCTAATPALSRKRSALKCDADPTPGEEKLNAPGFALAAATRSRTVLKPLSGRTTRTKGVTPSGTTAAKSRAG